MIIIKNINHIIPKAAQFPNNDFDDSISQNLKHLN